MPGRRGGLSRPASSPLAAETAPGLERDRSTVPLFLRGTVPPFSRGRVPLFLRGRVPLFLRGRVNMDNRRTATAIVVLALLSALGIWSLTRPPDKPSQPASAARTSAPGLTTATIVGTGSPGTVVVAMPTSFTPTEVPSQTVALPFTPTKVSVSQAPTATDTLPGIEPLATRTPRPATPTPAATASPGGAEVTTGTLAPTAAPAATATLDTSARSATAVIPSPTTAPLPSTTPEGSFPYPPPTFPPYP